MGVTAGFLFLFGKLDHAPQQDLLKRVRFTPAFCPRISNSRGTTVARFSELAIKAIGRSGDALLRMWEAGPSLSDLTPSSRRTNSIAAQRGRADVCYSWNSVRSTGRVVSWNVQWGESISAALRQHCGTS